MAAILEYDIGVSNQELIRDRIAMILKEELTNQATRQANEELDAEVYTEYYSTPDEVEERVIVVGIDRGSFDNHTQIHQTADFMYYIDIYTFGKAKGDNDGYLVSSLVLQRLAGLVRSILQAPQYVRLAFDTEQIIHRRSVSNIVYDLTGEEEDASSSRMCRVSLKVEFSENQPGQEPIVAVGYDTQVKIEETDKGFKYTIEN